mgnify:CR=1 FL=1
MSKYLTKIEAVKKMLEDHKHLTISELNRRTGLSRTVFYAWQKGKFENLQEESVQKVADATNTIIQIEGNRVLIPEQDIQIKGEANVDAQYIIDLQKDKIKAQEKEIAMFKEHIKTQPLQKLQFDDIAEDMSSTVYVRNVFSLKPMERKMTKFKNSEIIEKKLGLPKGHDFFGEDQWFSFNEHPVDNIIDKNTLNELNKITRTLPSLFESLKFMVGSHYMTFPVVYEYKNKRVRTMCYILLDWMSSPKRILTKSIILNGENN